MDKSKKTQFDTVECRLYPVVLSDNPGGKYGPSIELGWDYTELPNSGQRRLSVYERQRQKERVQRFYLSHARRESILREASYSKADIRKATSRKRSIQRRRASSNLFMSPITKIKSRVREGRRARKLKAANRNLQKMEDGDRLFYEHNEVYKGWWKPHLEVTLFK
ncbi:hypothetical protein ACHAXT_001173 [Thalassiosira profunda]